MGTSITGMGRPIRHQYSEAKPAASARRMSTTNTVRKVGRSRVGFTGTCPQCLGASESDKDYGVLALWMLRRHRASQPGARAIR